MAACGGAPATLVGRHVGGAGSALRRYGVVTMVDPPVVMTPIVAPSPVLGTVACTSVVETTEKLGAFTPPNVMSEVVAKLLPEMVTCWPETAETDVITGFTKGTPDASEAKKAMASAPGPTVFVGADGPLRTPGWGDVQMTVDTP